MGSDGDVYDNEVGRIKAGQLGQMGLVPYCLKAIIQLGVPEILMNARPGTKLTAEEIARSIPGKDGKPADAENLEIILRLLTAYEVLTEEATTSSKDPDCVERRYGATSVVKSLVDNEDGVSMAPLIELTNDNVFASAFQLLHEAVLDKTVEPLVLAHGKTCFEYAVTDERFNNLFNKAMANHSHTFVKMLLNDKQYRGFEGINTLVDIGGGLGASLAMILEKHPKLRGINFDQPHVVAKGIQTPRLEHVGGSFFESVPRADAVWMKWILHDWSDEHCLKILRNIHEALPPQGKIIIADVVLPETTDSSLLTRNNLSTHVLMMAVNSGGKERTLTEFRKLAARAGFKRVEVAAKVEFMCILEFYKT